MTFKSITKSRTHRNTWCILIRDQEFNLAFHLLNTIWNKKEQRKLPWYGAEMQVILSRILRY